ncbi:hypothetical protein F2P79_020499 [Pimephales promelas]|nr:hypothetical protein F2P79_020499 [Pimephales promelas]
MRLVYLPSDLMSAWLSVYHSAARFPVQQQPFHHLSVRPAISNQSSGPVIIIDAENCQWEQCPLWWRVLCCAVAVFSPSVRYSSDRLVTSGLDF